MGVITGLKLGGNGWPASRFTSGLGSKVSIWLGPPSMNRKITLLALAGRLHGGGRDDRGRGGRRDPAAASGNRNKLVSARAPNPCPGTEEPVAAGHRGMR